MNRLNDQAFQSLVNSNIRGRIQEGRPTDFQALAEAFLDRGIVPHNPRMWDWARQICQRGRAA